MKPYLFLLAVAMLLWSCKKEEVIPVSGSMVLSTNSVLEGQYITRGFSFADAKFHSFPGTAASQVDLIAFASSDSSGQRTLANLISPSNEDSAFFLAGQFNTLTEANNYFDGLINIPEASFVGVTPPLQPFEVWVVQTGRGTFAKILVREIRQVQSNDGFYLDIYLDWKYQPNGTRTF